MRKLKIIEHISLDGVIQAPGGPEEDTGSGFKHGGWSAPHHDAEAGKAIMEAQGDAFDLLLGRRTYDIFSGFWPKAPKSPMADRLNAVTKYVATHRPKSLEWAPVEELGADIVEGVRRVKAKQGPQLIVWGSSTAPRPQAFWTLRKVRNWRIVRATHLAKREFLATRLTIHHSQHLAHDQMD